MKRLFLFMALLCLYMAQSTRAQVKPLAVGDKFPDIEFNNLIRHSKSKFKVSDFKGKLVILDFWSTDCSSCIVEMPEMGRLQKQFGDQIRILPIVSSPGKALLRFGMKRFIQYIDSAWNQNPYLYKASKLPTILDTLLYPKVEHFPLAGLKIWIDGDGIVRGITSPEYVNEKEISNMLKGNFPKWRTWKQLGYNLIDPLIDINSNQYRYSKSNYSVFEKYREYYTENGQYRVDSILGTKRFLRINSPILNLYSRIYDKFVDNAHQRIIVESKNKNRFYKDEYSEEWNAKNTYCFEKVMPIDVSDENFAKSVISELDANLKIKSTIETREVRCLVLKVANANLFAKTITEDDNDSSYGTLNTALIWMLGDYLPEARNMPVIFDTKLLKQYQDKRFQDFVVPGNNYNDPNAIHAALQLRGLKLVESMETIPMIVLKDNYSK